MKIILIFCSEKKKPRFVFMNGARQKGKRINTLLRYREVMHEFDKHDIRVIPITVVHRKFINPKFHISRDTLYRILSTPIEEELKLLQA